MHPGGSGQLPPICWGGHNFKTFIGRYRRFIAHPELKTSKIYSVFRSIVSQKENGLHHHHHRFFFYTLIPVVLCVGQIILSLPREAIYTVLQHDDELL